MRAAAFQILVAFLVGLVGFGQAQADEPTRGQLPDGRAFRTDLQGNQIVDYIAELELAVDALNRRVHGLESEVEEKDALVGRLQEGSSGVNRMQASDFHEKDILPAQEEVVETKAKEIDEVIAERVAAIEKETEQLPQQDESCQRELGELRTQLMAAREDFKIEQQVHSREIQEMRSQLHTLRTKLETSNAELAAGRTIQVKAERAETETEFETRHVTAPKFPEVGTLEVAVKPSEEKAALKPELLEAAATTEKKFVPVLPPVESLQTAQMKAVLALRGDIEQELGSLKSDIRKRDQLFRQYHSAKPALTLKARKPITKRGKALGTVSKQIETAGTVHELAALRRDLRDISKSVNKDIMLIQRLKG